MLWDADVGKFGNLGDAGREKSEMLGQENLEFSGMLMKENLGILAQENPGFSGMPKIVNLEFSGTSPRGSRPGRSLPEDFPAGKSQTRPRSPILPSAAPSGAGQENRRQKMGIAGKKPKKENPKPT